MAGRAISKVGLRGNAEVVQYVFFANTLLVIRIKEFPGPVFGLVDLFRCFVVALYAGLCDVRA